MQTILKCPNCTQALMLVKESRGNLKDGKPSEVMVDKLRCPNCGSVYGENKSATAYKNLRK